jgi:hypothetical protein
MPLDENELTTPERTVRDAVATGESVSFRTQDPALDDPAQGATWGEDRQVRAELLYELLTGVLKPEDGRPRTLRLSGARITGALTLEATELVCPLVLQGCSFEEPIKEVRRFQ